MTGPRKRLSTLCVLALCLTANALHAGRSANEYWEAGRQRVAAKQYEDAARIFRKGIAAHPDDVRLISSLGHVAWLQRDRDQAIKLWRKAYELDPESDARNLLRMVAPPLLEPVALIETLDELQELLPFLRDFRRQEEVSRAFHTFTTKKGLALAMKPGDWMNFVTALHELGYLKRPGGPPSGEGKYLTGQDGNVYSTVYGRRDAPEGGPPVLRNKHGWFPLPSVATEAVLTGDSGAIEFALKHVSAGILLRRAGDFGAVFSKLADPWARDAILDRLGGADVLRKALPDALKVALQSIADTGESAQKRRAEELMKR